MNIDVFLKDKEQYKNEFNENELNPEFGNYIFNKVLVYNLNKKQKFKINVQTDFEIDETEKNNIVDMIRSYYGNLVKIELINIRITYIKSVVLFVIGTVLIMLSYLFENITRFLLPEIFVIIGWLAIGEMAYSILFSNNKHRLKIKLLKQLTNCHIEINRKK